MKKILLALILVGVNFISTQACSKVKHQSKVQDFSKERAEYIQRWHQKYFLTLSAKKQKVLLETLNKFIELFFLVIDSENKALTTIINEATANKQISDKTIEKIQENQAKNTALVKKLYVYMQEIDQDKELKEASDKMTKYQFKSSLIFLHPYLSKAKSAIVQADSVDIEILPMSKITTELLILLEIAKICQPVSSIQSKL